MTREKDKTLELFCTVIALKEKKRALYKAAAQNCPDPVGVETFSMLKTAEEEHLRRTSAIYEEVKKGKVPADACRLHEFGVEDKKALLKRIAKAHRKVPKACHDEVAAIETGLALENEAITFFTKRLEVATDPSERAFLTRLIAGDKEHHTLLADLKFYYTDPESWFLEKGKQVLDGSGAGA